MEGKEVSDATVAQIKPEIILFRGFTWTLRHVWSPFVVKLEARLRFAGVPYKAAAGTPREAPRGKVPYIQLGNDPALIGDSTIIIRTLIDQGVIPDLNKELSGEEKARDLAIRALLEDKLYFFLVRSQEKLHSRYDQILCANHTDSDLGSRALGRQLLQNARWSFGASALPDPCGCRLPRPSQGYGDAIRPRRFALHQSRGCGTAS